MKLPKLDKKIFLISIILISIVLRFWQLGQNPPSLSWDEVAWGYNAYTLGIDGKDEFGRFLPFDYLESFGDFKPPVYAYVDIIPIKIFGLTAFAARFPSALFGVLTVFATYFLVKRIFDTSKRKEYYALFTALFLAVSPWHIMLSRGAFEANVVTFFLVTGVWAFLAGLEKKKWLLFVSVIMFVLSLYTFNTPRIVTPLLVLGLAIGFRKELLMQWKRVLFACLLGIVLVLPTVPFLLSPQASLRFKEVNIFSDFSVIERTNQEIGNDNNAWWSKIIHNRRLVYGVSYIEHYLDHFNPSFLFIRGDVNPRFSTQDVGQLYLWDLPFFFIGIFFLFRKREGRWWIVPLWILIGIIPAATARETPHALRIETTLPMFQLLSAYGFTLFLFSLKKRSALLGSILLFFLGLNVLYFLHGYFVHYPKEYSQEWQYGYKESISYVKSVSDQYDAVYMTTELGRPYVYYLFYLPVHPSDFRAKSDVERDAFGFVTVNRYGKYHFIKDMTKKEPIGKTLYIDIQERVPKNATIQQTFYLLNGKSALVAYTL